MSYNSKYTGQEVEELLDMVANGDVGGGSIGEETDPKFTASPASGIKDSDITNWNNKVDKVSGKQLSTEDFTTTLKQKLDGLSNYDDTAINQAVASKQSIITDLDLIRSGASKGATALQEETYKGTVGTVDTSETLDEAETAPFVKYVLQSLTEGQKEQARTNIGAASISDLEGIDFSKLQTSKSISILFVGNSLTQDGIAYLPYILKNYYPEVDFKLYMWYIGGYTLAQHYSTFTSGGYANTFSVAENNASWTNYSKNKTMSWVLQNYTFDIVCMQEYFNYKTSYDDCKDWNDCRDYIRANYKGGNALEFISLFHAPLRKDGYDVHEVYNRTKDGNALILQSTISEDVIPNGIAVYRALETDLNSLGDLGQLSPDGTHTQEGLPCLLQTYVTLCWLFDRLGINKSVYGHPMRMNTTIYNTLNVPGPNLGSGVIQGTDAQNILAQEIAIKAYKEGKQFTMNNLSPYYTSSSSKMCTFTIETNVNNALVKINGIEQSSITVISGTVVNWEVSKNGYETQTGSEVVNSDTTKNVELEFILGVESVTAEFTQGARTIFSNQELDDLKECLVVTANYTNGTSDVVEDYSLTGELSEETSVITVSFMDKITTFSVAVTLFEIPEGYTRYGYIQGKNNSSGSTRELGSFIYLSTQEDYNALSMEVTLGEKPNLAASGAGILGARPASGKYYALYLKDAGLRADLRGVNVTAPYPTSRLKYTAKLDNPETSPASLSINNGEPVTVEWAEPNVISGTMSLFNNIPYGSTTKLYINHTIRIGDIIHRKANGECIGYYTPAVYGNKIGMYDQVSKQFYTAKTTNAVTVGNSGCLYEVGNW